MTTKPEYNQVVRIKVFGVGGAGCNAVNRMVNDKYFIKSYSSEEVDNFTFSVEGEFLLYQKMK